MTKLRKNVLILMFAVALVAWFSQAAVADYVDPPDWSSNAYYTHQSWDFIQPAGEFNAVTGELATPYAPDEGAWVNPYGTPYFTHTNSDPPEGTWGWTDYGMGMYNPNTYGSYGGMAPGYVQFEIPNAAVVDLKKELWIQYVLYLPRDGLGPDSAANASVWTDGGEGTRIDKYWEQVYEGEPGSGSSGLWWMVTELWEIDPQPGKEYVKIFADNAGGPAVLIDEIDIDTRCVPIPGAVYLLGSGLIGLIGIRRRKKS